MIFWKRFSLLFGGLLSLVGCTGVDVLNLTIPRSGYTVYSDIAYGRNPRQKLDIYVPDAPAAGSPVLVFFHGGSWKFGDKDQYLFVGQAFASQGITTVIANYQFYPKIYFPVFMEDAASAFAWTHKNIANYGGNPNNLFVAGHSAGGYNAIMLTVNDRYLKDAGGNTSWIKGAIGIAGPYDFLPMTDPDVIGVFSKVDAASTQPINYVKPGLPPMLLVTGDEDEDVLPRNAINLTARLRADGDFVIQKTYPGVAHIGIVLSLARGFRSKAPTLDDSISFITTFATKTPIK